MDGKAMNPPPYSEHDVHDPNKGYAPQNVAYPQPGQYQGYQVGHPPPFNQGQPVMSAPHVTVQPVAPANVVIVGGCPSCRVGMLEDDYTCCGIFLAIFFFPIGILCCLAMKQRRCTNCGAIFG